MEYSRWIARALDAEPVVERKTPRPLVITSERWDGHQWIERRLIWDGESYKPEVSECSQPTTGFTSA